MILKYLTLFVVSITLMQSCASKEKKVKQNTEISSSNEDIENSNADIARDLRILVRNMLSEGKTKDEIISYIHSRYGDFVLFNPPVRFDTSLLWVLPIIFLMLLCYTFFRKKH